MVCFFPLCPASIPSAQLPQQNHLWDHRVSQRRERSSLGLCLGQRGAVPRLGELPRSDPQRAVSAPPRGDGAAAAAATQQGWLKLVLLPRAACHETKPQSSPGPWPCPRQAAAPEKPSSESHPCAPRATETLRADGIRRINAVSTLLCRDFRGKAVMRLISSETCRKWIWTVNNEAYCKW